MVELDGKPAPDVRVSFAGPVAAAREVDAQERPIGSAIVDNGSLVTSFTAYQPRTFALRLNAPQAKLAATNRSPVALQYDLAVATNDDTKTNGGGFDGKGNAIPAEMLPDYDQLSRCAVQARAFQDRYVRMRLLQEDRRSNCPQAGTTVSTCWQLPQTATRMPHS